MKEGKKLKECNDLSKTPIKGTETKNNQCRKVNRKLDIRGKVRRRQCEQE